MAKYRKKPVIIEALQFTGENFDEIIEFSGGKGFKDVSPVTPYPFCVTIKTLEGIMRATKGDWIIKGVNEEFYPCKPDIFQKTYEKVE